MGETVTFEKILFEIQLDLYNSVRIYFNDFFVCREFNARLHNCKYKNILHDINIANIDDDYFLAIYNFKSNKFNHANYEYIGDNQFKLIGDIIYEKSNF